MNTYEIKKKLSELYNCGTCRFSYYEPKNKNESQKCSLVGKFNTVGVNRKIEYLIAKYDLKSVCEAWRIRK